MVEMHLLSVSADFTYDPIYALGVVMTFDQFMQGYRPDADKLSIFNAVCRAVELDPEQIRQDAATVQTELPDLTLDLLEQRLPGGPQAGQGVLGHQFQAIANNPKFKFSRLFATGLYAIVAAVSPEAIDDETQRKAIFQQMSDTLNLPGEKLQKDLEFYRSNLEKMNQAQQVMQDILEADRKQREERAQRLAQKQANGEETAEVGAAAAPDAAPDPNESSN